MADSGNGGENNAQIQGLEFVIKTVSEQAKGIQEVKKGLEELGDSVKKMPNSKKFNGLVNSLSKLNTTNLANLNGVISGLNELSKVGTIKARIPERFIDELSVLNIVSQSMKSETIGAVGRALQNFNGLQLPKIPAGFANGLTTLGTASQSIQADKIEQLGRALHSLDGMKFSEDLPKNLSAIASVSSASSQIDAGKLYALIPALKAFQGLNFSFAPAGLTSSLKDIVSACNAVTNSTVDNAQRLAIAMKLFEKFNMPNAGSFRELGEALSYFANFYVTDGFTMSMRYIADGVKVFQEISEGDIKKVAQLTMLFNNMPTEEMANFYNVLDSFGSVTRSFSELGKINFAPLKHVLDTISHMDMAGKTAIAPEFITSIQQLMDTAKGIEASSLADFFESLQSFGKQGKNFKFPTGFANFAKEIKTAVSLFPNDKSNFGAGWREFSYQMQSLGEIKGIRSVADLFTAFSNMKDISISADIVTRMKEITDFVKSITTEDIDKIKDYAEALKYLGEMSKGVKIPKMPKTSSEKTSKTTESVKKNVFQEIFSELPIWAQAISKIVGTGLKGVLWLYKEIGKGALDAVKNLFTLKGALQALQTVGNVVTAPVKAIQALDKAITNIPKRIQKFVSHITKTIKGIEKFIKSIQKAVKNVQKFMQTVGQKFTAPFENIAKKVLGLFKSIERMALYRVIRSLIKVVSEGFQEGLENLYEYSKLVSSEFHKSMDKIATDALYIKNSLAAMVEPLINAFAPAIDAITDKFVSLLNLINQTFSALTGKSVFTAAKKYKTVWMEADDATKKTSDSTKKTGDTIKETLEKIKRYTLAFDELNILGEPKDDDSSNKIKDSTDDSDKDKDTKDYLAMFEQRPVEKTISDFFKKIRDAIQNGKFYDVGKIIAEKFNEIVSSIDFGKLGETIGEKINHVIAAVKGFLDFANFEALGEGVAKFLNRAFSEISFYNLGEVLAGKIRLAIDFAYGFVNTFSFKGFGHALANLVNGFIISIDFERLAITLTKGFGQILEGIAEFFSSLQSFAIGRKLKEFFDGFEKGFHDYVLNDDYNVFDLVAEEFNQSFTEFLMGLGVEIDSSEHAFERLGAHLGTQLTNIFYSIDYAGWGQILGEKIQNAVASARNFWQNLDLTGLGSGIAEFINNAIANIDFYSVGMTIAEKLSTVFNGVASFLNTVNWDSLFESVSLAVTGFFENLNLQTIDIGRITRPLAKAFDTIVTKMTDFLIDAFKNPVNVAAIGTAIGKMLNSVITNAFRFLESTSADDGTSIIAQFFNNIFEEIDNDTLAKLINRVITDAFAIVRQLLEKIDFREVGAIIGKVLLKLDLASVIGETISGILEGLGAEAGGIWGFLFGSDKKDTKKILEDADQISEKISDMTEKSSLLGAVIKKIGSWIFPDTVVHAGEMETGVSTAMAGISTSSSDLVQDLDADSVSWATICEKFQDNFNTGMDEIVKKHKETKEKSAEQWQLWQESFNETVDNVLRLVEKIKTGFKVMGNSIAQSIKNSLNRAISVFEGFVNNWIIGFNDIADVINSFTIDIPAWVPGLGGNSWSPNMPKFPEIQLARYDKGGFPTSGDLFFANENGSPELVGRMGSQTAVANQDQIIQGIAQGVMMAMNSGSQNQLIRQAITILQAIAEKDNSVVVTTAQIDKAKNRQNLRNGVLS